MNRLQKIVFASIAGYVVVALGVLGIAVNLIPPESRSQFFWHRLLWTEFLLLIIWGTLFSFFASSSRKNETHREVIGILPAANLVLLTYAGLSFLIMLAYAYLPQTVFWGRIHLVFQILIAVMAGGIISFLSIASATAGLGLERTFAVGFHPTDLCGKIQEQELRVHQFPADPNWHGLEKSLKTLREAIRFSIPDVGNIGSSEDYNEFAQKVHNLCDDLSMHSDPADTELGSLQNQLNTLLYKVKTLSSNSIRR